jgi:hypothetical protein
MAKLVLKPIKRKLFVLVYLLSLLSLGITYLSIVPIFEGFDETGHFSSLRQISGTGTIPLYGESYLDQFVVDFQGPIPYSTGIPPFDRGMVYMKFFKHPELIEYYIQTYRQQMPATIYRPSHVLNWQAQHPPLYYLLLAPLITTFSIFSFTAQIFLLRLASYLLALSGVALGILAVKQLPQAPEQNIAVLGFLLYPIILPMFFPEFARIGNDSLCIFLVGLVAYLLSLWLKDEHNIKISVAIGIVLGMGLLTKALFLPIASALTIFLLVRAWMNTPERSKRLWSLLQILLPALFIGGGWYLYNLLVFGQIIGSNEAILLANQGGLIAGLKENLSLNGFVTGMIVPFVSYSWAGTWSVVRLPALLHLPLLALTMCIFIVYARQLKSQPLDNPIWLPVWVLVFFAGGLFWHMLVGLALNGNGATPGWYLHILMPWVAPAIGMGIVGVFQCGKARLLLMILLLYAVLYHIMALWSQFALFTGCASKGPDKYYIFSGNFLCLDQVSVLMNRASVLGYPFLAIFSFLVWTIANLWLFRQVWKNRMIFME